MTREELHKKIMKVQALYLKGATRGEQQAAKAMLDKLCEKYDFNLEELEEKKVRIFRYNRTAKFIALKIGWHLDLDMYHYTKGGFKIGIKCTEMEWDLFNSLYDSVNAMYMRKKAEYHNKLQSEMKGYLDQAYPSKDPACPKCGSDKFAYNQTSGRVECMAKGCGYSKKIRYRNDNIDRESYSQGKRSGVKQIGGN